MKVVSPVHSLPMSRWAVALALQESIHVNLDPSSRYSPRVTLVEVRALLGGDPPTRIGVKSSRRGRS